MFLYTQNIYFRRLEKMTKEQTLDPEGHFDRVISIGCYPMVVNIQHIAQGWKEMPLFLHTEATLETQNTINQQMQTHMF